MFVCTRLYHCIFTLSTIFVFCFYLLFFFCFSLFSKTCFPHSNFLHFIFPYFFIFPVLHFIIAPFKFSLYPTFLFFQFCISFSKTISTGDVFFKHWSVFQKQKKRCYSITSLLSIILNFQKFFHSNVKIGAYLLQHSNLHYFTPVFVSKISIRNGNIASCSLQ